MQTNLQPRQAAPLTRELMEAFVCDMVINGNCEAVICVAVSWGSMLRSSEDLYVKVSDIALPGDPRHENAAATSAELLVRRGKTGLNQLGIITEHDIVHIIR